MTPQNPNDVIQVAEALYYKLNPETKMDVPSSVYEITAKWSKEWAEYKYDLTLYDWILEYKKFTKNK